VNAPLVAVALGVTVAACQAAPALPTREVERVGGPGWSIDLPVDLGLDPSGLVANEAAGTWMGSDAGGASRHVTVLIVRDAQVPLERYADTVRLNSAERLRGLESVVMPVGRAFLAHLSNDRAPDSHTVIMEVEPGLIVTIGTFGLTAADTVAIARSFRDSGP